MKRAVLGSLLAVTVLCGGLALLCATGVVRKAAIYEVPDGYRGRLAVVYAQEEGPLLKRGLLTETIRFDDSGLVLTRSRLSKGWSADFFYYVDSAGRRLRRIPAREIGFRFVQVGPFRGKVASIFAFSIGSPDDIEHLPSFDDWLHEREKEG